jgi:hypothetical protein
VNKKPFIHRTYRDLVRVGKPIPWEGMPVYAKSISAWLFCTSTVHNTSNEILLDCRFTSRHQYWLCSYKKSIAENNFTLPGEPNCPEMPEEVWQHWTGQYTFGEGIQWSSEGKRHTIRISYAPLHKYNEVLWLPYGIDQSLLFNSDDNAQEDQRVPDQMSYYCSCSEPQLTQSRSFTGFDTFQVCTLCKKEKR